MDEGHDADDEADETRQHGQDHEGSGSVPVSCGTGAAHGEVIMAVVRATTLSAVFPWFLVLTTCRVLTDAGV